MNWFMELSHLTDSSGIAVQPLNYDSDFEDEDTLREQFVVEATQAAVGEVRNNMYVTRD